MREGVTTGNLIDPEGLKMLCARREMDNCWGWQIMRIDFLPRAHTLAARTRDVWQQLAQYLHSVSVRRKHRRSCRMFGVRVVVVEDFVLFDDFWRRYPRPRDN